MTVLDNNTSIKFSSNLFYIQKKKKKDKNLPIQMFHNFKTRLFKIFKNLNYIFIIFIILYIH